MFSKVRLALLVLVGLATCLHAGTITIYPDNTWTFVEVCTAATATDDCPTVATFALDLSNQSGGSTREIRFVDGFKSGDMYDIVVNGDTDNPHPTSSVINGPDTPDQSLEGNDPATLANNAWGKHDTFSWIAINLDIGNIYTIDLWRTQQAIDPWEWPYEEAGVFVFVDPPIDAGTVPEPATFGLIGLALGALALKRRL